MTCRGKGPPLQIDSSPTLVRAIRHFDGQCHEREVTIVHHLGSTARRPAYLHIETDLVFIAWGIAGEYEMALRSGRLIGAPNWHVAPPDLAWFRKRSRRWQERKRRRAQIFANRKKTAP